ncbi:2531_t:CDS:2 [Funneliformis caledonium]|uniref:2531_t:CDS:1 n=1 Tax=Funneliformis caledonium TaxID=1117310 RepID=A0A9N9GZ72_9GLOM|nr:2531_t:CDS:2 [Funneliformis caledonium]
MSLGSIPFVYQLIFSANWNVNDLPKESNLSIVLVGFFMTYCILDLLIGRFFYKHEISNVTSMKGYLHHLIHLAISGFVIYKQQTEIFCLMSIFEVSTLVLATEKFNNKSLKQEILYVTTFISTRLLFHAMMIHLYYNYHPSKSTWLILALLYPLQCYWLYGYIKQQLNMRNQRKKRSQLNKILYNNQELEMVLNSLMMNIL